MKEKNTNPSPEAKIEVVTDQSLLPTEGEQNDTSTELPQVADKVKELEEKVKELEALQAVEKDKYMRLCAEFDNFRRRTAQERLALVETAGEKILQQILPVVDDFERALHSLAHEKDAAEGLSTGIHAIHHKLVHILEQAGVAAIQLERGSSFDPELHEAIAKTPIADLALQGKVVEVVEKGYLLRNKVLRHAKVIVGE
jgi:molecular chaperone GrpE